MQLHTHAHERAILELLAFRRLRDAPDRYLAFLRRAEEFGKEAIAARLVRCQAIETFTGCRDDRHALIVKGHRHNHHIRPDILDPAVEMLFATIQENLQSLAYLQHFLCF